MKVSKIVALSLVSACAFKPAAPVETTGPSIQSVSGLKLELKEYDAPNSYGVALSWEDVGKGQAILLRRVDQDGRITQLDTLPIDEHSFEDKSVLPTVKYSYQLAILSGEALAQKLEAEIQIPSDLAFSGLTTIGNVDSSIRRIFLNEGVVARTNGEEVTIDVNEIVSRNGVIETFAEGTTAAAGQNGRSGGRIYIKTKKGRGNLTILARGENGGAGFQGPTGGSGAGGGPGRNGVADSESICRQPLSTLRPPSEGGRCYQNWYCSVETGDGASGGQGLPGGPGESGRSGGDSALIVVEVSDPSGFEINPVSLPGAGGAGGSGGRGGPGGPGGPPGAGDPRGKCRIASTGPQGGSGPLGAAGPIGISGIKQPICTRLGETAFGECGAL